MKEQLSSAFYRLLSTWPFMLFTALVLIIISNFTSLSFSSALFAFVSAACGLAWASAPLAKEREQNAKVARSKTAKRKNEKIIWEQLIESIPDPVFILGPQNKLLYANEQAKNIFNIKRLGVGISAIIRTPKLLEAIDAVTESKEKKKIQLVERTPIERQFTVNIAWLAREDKSDPTILVHFRDLTEQERLNRMRADFIANASHELRTPIASLLGFVETLQGPAKNDEAAREKFLGIMAVQGRRMTNLVDDLLSLSRVEMNAHKIPNEKVNLVTLLHNTMDSLTPLAEQQNIKLEFEEPEEEFVAIGEEDELSQVFQNLVHNAIKYGKSDGEGYVRLFLAHIKRDKNKQEQIKVIVEDNGIGIASHHIPRLTERFYRADIEQSREKGGTGLGLAITKHIITRHRGELKVNSRKGHGSIFSVLLPKA
ncbi:MAG: ATP-binding protein [Hyphomicrobiales bacterium]